MSTNDEAHSNGKATIGEKYEQGSKCCQQYSQLTMDVRKQSLVLLATYGVAIGLILARSDIYPPPHLRPILMLAGVIILLFAIVLSILNYHHSKAFRAIRDDFLVHLEGERADFGKEQAGPWRAHKAERGHHWFMGWLAWWFPFIALGLIGALSLYLGWSRHYLQYMC